MFREFFERGFPQQGPQAPVSARLHNLLVRVLILSKDGYVLTNNHVLSVRLLHAIFGSAVRSA